MAVLAVLAFIGCVIAYVLFGAKMYLFPQLEGDAAQNCTVLAIIGMVIGGYLALGQAMVSCFGVLSSQMSSTHARTISAMGQIQSQNAELISQAKLSNALQTKANLTSDKLCNDLSYIKDKAALTF